MADTAMPAGNDGLNLSTDDVLHVSALPTLWTDARGLTNQGHELLDQIEMAEQDGLDPQRYQLQTLKELTSEAWHPTLREPVNQLMATAFELLITDLGQGLLDPSKSQKRWYQTPNKINPQLAYHALKLPGNTVTTVIDQHRPALPNYKRLKKALGEYREIAKNGGWPTIASGATIELGTKDKRVAQIEKRLVIGGDLLASDLAADTSKPNTFSRKALLATKRFQRRHGLPADGSVGKETLAAMNISVNEKIENLELNLERMRWLPRNLGDRHIFVNVAEFKLRLMDRGEEILNMPVVVGKKKHMTPIFSDQVEYLVVNPTWTVPTSITFKELLPIERRNPGYLAREEYELISRQDGRAVLHNPNSIDRSEFESGNFRYTIRQKPGEKNALGKVKFIFPNKYSVYLHDTPAKKLFSRPSRAFSHGCVRVADPIGLAEKLLGHDGWSEKRFDEAFADKKLNKIYLKEPLKNHITYITSWADNQGRAQFRKDIYGHDERLKSAMRETRSGATAIAALEE